MVKLILINQAYRLPKYVMFLHSMYGKKLNKHAFNIYVNVASTFNHAKIQMFFLNLETCSNWHFISYFLHISDFVKNNCTQAIIE